MKKKGREKERFFRLNQSSKKKKKNMKLDTCVYYYDDRNPIFNSRNIFKFVSLSSKT